MPRLKRSEICARDEVQAFHLINRCVRRTYLCGKEKRSGKDYSHRKQWIRDRLEELAGIFGIDLKMDRANDFLVTRRAEIHAPRDVDARDLRPRDAHRRHERERDQRYLALKLSTNCSYARSHFVTVFSGPVSLMKYGPLGVSTTPARRRVARAFRSPMVATSMPRSITWMRSRPRAQRSSASATPRTR